MVRAGALRAGQSKHHLARARARRCFLVLLPLLLLPHFRGWWLLVASVASSVAVVASACCFHCSVGGCFTVIFVFFLRYIFIFVFRGILFFQKLSRFAAAAGGAEKEEEEEEEEQRRRTANLFSQINFFGTNYCMRV